MNSYQAIRRNKAHNNCVHSVRYFETDWTSESGIVVELYSPIQVAGFSSSHDLPQDARCNTIVGCYMPTIMMVLELIYTF